jgi:PKHD-type hydroxylase
MMIEIPAVLDAAAVAQLRGIIDAADWIDGNATSGHQSALAKRNRQLPEDSAAAREAGKLILDALGRSPLFFAAALPLKIFPPLFNSYEAGEAFDIHVDNAVRIKRGNEFRLRSDLSATLFLEIPTPTTAANS